MFYFDTTASQSHQRHVRAVSKATLFRQRALRSANKCRYLIEQKVLLLFEHASSLHILISDQLTSIFSQLNTTNYAGWSPVLHSRESRPGRNFFFLWCKITSLKYFADFFFIRIPLFESIQKIQIPIEKHDSGNFDVHNKNCIRDAMLNGRATWRQSTWQPTNLFSNNHQLFPRKKIISTYLNVNGLSSFIGRRDRNGISLGFQLKIWN